MCKYAVRGVGGILISLVRTYEHQDARYLHTHDKQTSRLSCRTIDVALVVRKGERFRYIVANGLERISERVLSWRRKALQLTPKYGNGETEKPKYDRPLDSSAKPRYGR